MIKKSMMLIFLVIACFNGILAQDLSENIQTESHEHVPVTPEKQLFVYEPIESLDKIEKDIKAIDPSNIRNHTFGEDIAKRLFLFEKNYVYYSDPAPGAFSGKKVIQKPVIYNSIYKIEKHLRKQVRKGNIDKQTARVELSNLLEVAIILLHEDTEMLEEELRKTRPEEGIMAVFNRIIIK